jgi:hypothetical protein
MTKPFVYPIAFDLSQAAEMLGVNRRWLLEWLWKHPCDSNGTPYYRKAGRTKLFRESEVARIYAALPVAEAPRCPSPSSRRDHPTRTMRSAAATSTSNAYIRVRELLRSASKGKSVFVKTSGKR